MNTKYEYLRNNGKSHYCSKARSRDEQYVVKVDELDYVCALVVVRVIACTSLVLEIPDGRESVLGKGLVVGTARRRPSYLELRYIKCGKRVRNLKEPFCYEFIFHAELRTKKQTHRADWGEYPGKKQSKKARNRRKLIFAMFPGGTGDQKTF